MFQARLIRALVMRPGSKVASWDPEDDLMPNIGYLEMVNLGYGSILGRDDF